jgi:hypothetical protein
MDRRRILLRGIADTVEIGGSWAIGVGGDALWQRRDGKKRDAIEVEGKKRKD